MATTLNDKFVALGNSIINLTDRKVGAYNTEFETALSDLKDRLDAITTQVNNGGAE